MTKKQYINIFLILFLIMFLVFIIYIYNDQTIASDINYISNINISCESGVGREQVTSRYFSGAGRVTTELHIEDIDTDIDINTNVSVESDKYYNIELDKDIQDYLISLCKDKYNNVPIELVLSLIKKESNFESNIISKTDDYGICQINKINHDWLSKELNITNFLDPYQNILCCVHMLSNCLNIADNNIEKALMCYNLGNKGAKSYWDKGIYSTSYSKEVYDNYIYLLNNRTFN